MEIGRVIYYDKTTGNVVLDKGEREGSVVETSLEQDLKIYPALSEISPEILGIIELDYGRFAQDFAECNGYRVNLETKELEFSYPDPNEPEEPQPYQPPLSEEVNDIRKELKTTQEAVDFLIMGGMM